MSELAAFVLLAGLLSLNQHTVAAAPTDLLPTDGVSGAQAAAPGAATALPGTMTAAIPTAGPAVANGALAGPGAAPAAGAAPGAAGNFQTVSAIPTSPLAAAPPGQCAANFAAGQQCGGNMTGTMYSCAMFPGSCTNKQWAGGCCPAGSACETLPTAGSWCMTCGGNIPKSLATAAENAPAEQPSMCLRMGPNNDFDYGCVLGASLMFFDAQRSGKLPANNKIKWRGNAGLLDKAPNGASLAGGWYDAGDMTRFTFPTSFAVANLALAYLEFPGAFDSNGHADALLGSLRWSADWLLAARYAPDAFVAVTWAPGKTVKESHVWWGKPEEVKQAAETRVLKAPKAGADLLGQGAAALAAVSVVFKERDPRYSAKLLEVARGLYNQAIDSRGLYSDSIPEVKDFYQSYSYIDDLAWAAAWLAMRTGEQEDIDSARFYLQQHISEEAGGDRRRYDYNNMLQGVSYLMAKLEPNRKDQWSRPIRDTMTTWLRGQDNITYTEKGMAWIDSWGNLRYVANQGFIGLLHNKLYPDQTQRSRVYACFARKQARIMLGETGKSYVVGVGTNPPCRPHHRAASCGPSPFPCDCSALYNPGCNPNNLYGALVGGPNKNDTFDDLRTDFAATEVTLDWNAALTGLMAGLTDNRITWDDCKSAGLQSKPGDIGPGLTSAGPYRHVRAYWQLLLLTAATVLVAKLL